MADAAGQGQGQSRIDIEGHGGTKFLGNIPPSTLSSLVVLLVQVREIPH